MAWTPHPLNLLLVDNNHRQPDFIGWYALDNLLVPKSNLAPKSTRRTGGHTTLLLPDPVAKVDKGLRTGISQVAKRNGNRNDSITLSADQGITTHPKTSDDKYLTSIPVTAGTQYTLGVTAISAYPGFVPAVVELKLLWINSSGVKISESGSAQGITSAYGIKIRNSVTGIAPIGAVGVVALFATNHPVILTYPTLSVGATDLRVGDPTESTGSTTFTPSGTLVPGDSIVVGTIVTVQELYLFPSTAGLFPGDSLLVGSGDNTPSLDNLFYYDLNSSAIPWRDGWTNEFGDRLVSNGDVLYVPASSEARLYFEEDLQSTTTMGVSVIPFTQYTLRITESPARTNATVQLKFYDVTGTRMLGTAGTTTVGNEIRASFVTPASAAYMAIKIVSDTETYFEAPYMVQGETIPDPGGGLSKVLCQWEFRSNSNQKLIKNTIFLSDISVKLNKSWVFSSDTVLLVNLDSLQILSDTQSKLFVSTQFVSDNTQKVTKSWQFDSTGTTTIHTEFTFVSDLTQKIASKTLTLVSNNNQKTNKTIVFATENLQIVGRQFPVGGVVTAADLASGILLLPSEPLYRPSRTLTILTDALQAGGVQKSWQFSTDSRQFVGTKSVRFDTDSLGMVPIRFESKTDNLFTIHKLFVFKSDIPPNVSVSTTFVFVSDNNGIVSKTLNIVSGRYPRLPKRVISTRPLREIGVV